MRGLSLVAASRGHSSSQCAGLSLLRPLLLRGTGSRRAGSVVVAHGPSCSASMWDLPRPGLEPVSPALAGRSLTTAPPGKPLITSYQWHMIGTWLNTGDVELDHFTSLNFLICTFLYCFSSYNKYVKTVNLQVLINRRPPQMWGLNFLFDQENWCPRLEEGRGDKYGYNINV